MTLDGFSFFTLPIPPSRLSKSPLTGDRGLVSSGLTWLMILSTPSFVAVLIPRRCPETPLMTCRVVHVPLALANISASIVPKSGRGVDDP